MRYFKLFDYLSPEGDLYRFDGKVLEFENEIGEWQEQFSYSVGEFDSPEEWFIRLLINEAAFGAPIGYFEEVPAP